MNELASMLSTLLRVFMFWLSACLLVWAFFPDAKPIAAGLILGSSVSIINAQLLGVKARQISKMAMENNYKKVSLGFLTRASMVLIAIMVAIRFEEQFHLMATIIGLLFFPVSIFVIGFLMLKRQ